MLKGCPLGRFKRTQRSHRQPEACLLHKGFLGPGACVLGLWVAGSVTKQSRVKESTAESVWTKEKPRNSCELISCVKAHRESDGMPISSRLKMNSRGEKSDFLQTWHRYKTECYWEREGERKMCVCVGGHLKFELKCWRKGKDTENSLARANGP